VGLRINLDRINYWTAQGAKVSPTVARLIKTQASAAPAAA
jgi:ribosomal protein S16